MMSAENSTDEITLPISIPTARPSKQKKIADLRTMQIEDDAILEVIGSTANLETRVLPPGFGLAGIPAADTAPMVQKKPAILLAPTTMMDVEAYQPAPASPRVRSDIWSRIGTPAYQPPAPAAAKKAAPSDKEEALRFWAALLSACALLVVIAALVVR